jgi:hypothetical protein
VPKAAPPRPLVKKFKVKYNDMHQQTPYLHLHEKQSNPFTENRPPVVRQTSGDRSPPVSIQKIKFFNETSVQEIKLPTGKKYHNVESTDVRYAA